MGVKKCSYKDIELIPTQESKHCWGGGMICRAAVHSPGTTWVRSWTLDSPSSSLSIFPTKRSGEDLELTTQSHGPLSHGFYSFAPEQSMSTYKHWRLVCFCVCESLWQYWQRFIVSLWLVTSIPDLCLDITSVLCTDWLCQHSCQYYFPLWLGMPGLSLYISGCWECRGCADIWLALIAASVAELRMALPINKLDNAIILASVSRTTKESWKWFTYSKGIW